jgi:SAM-dependent methyltransferase
VGAGRGSIARWLSARLGPGGHLVAADIDCRFLGDLPENVEVRELDIRSDDVETGSYDLVHCRALLMHLPDPLAALSRMAAALRPGGLLVAEEGDYGLLAYGGHPDGVWAGQLYHRVFAALAAAKVMHPYLGRALPGMLIEVGLDVVEAQVDGSVSRCGDPAFEFQRVTEEASAARLIAAGVLTQAERDRAREVMSCPSTILTGVAGVGVCARRTR